MDEKFDKIMIISLIALGEAPLFWLIGFLFSSKNKYKHLSKFPSIIKLSFGLQSTIAE